MLKKYLWFIIISLTLTSHLFAQHSQRDKIMLPELIMDTIGVKAGMVIGEIGAGEGYFTFKLAERVGPEGKIYANDIKKGVLGRIQKKCEEEHISNIQVIVGETTDPLFPKSDLDMIVMMMVYHDLEEPDQLIQNIKKYLKPGASLIIIDRDPDKWQKGWDHFLKKEKILENMSKTDFVLDRMEDFLSIDNIFVFRLK